MTTAKRTTTKKTSARKPTTTKKIAARKPSAKRAPAPPMAENVRAFAATIMGTATETALASELLGVKRQASTELTGARAGMVNRITLDDGTRLIVSVTARPTVRRGPGKAATDA
jgi:hypothetical protein